MYEIYEIYDIRICMRYTMCIKRSERDPPNIASTAPRARHWWVRNHIFFSWVFRSDPEGVAMGSRRLLGVSWTTFMSKKKSLKGAI